MFGNKKELEKEKRTKQEQEQEREKKKTKEQEKEKKKKKEQDQKQEQEKEKEKEKEQEQEQEQELTSIVGFGSNIYFGIQAEADHKKKFSGIQQNFTKEYVAKATIEIPNYVDKMKNGNLEEKYKATQQIRILLSVEKDPPIENILKCEGIFTTLDQFLDLDEKQELQFEALWCISNILAGSTEDVKRVIEAGSLPKLIKFLDSSKNALQEQCICAIGNIAGDCAELRDRVLEHEVIPKLIETLKSNTTTRIISCTLWTLSNIFRFEPQPKISEIMILMDLLCDHLNNESTDIAQEACWLLFDLTRYDQNNIEHIMKTDICKKMAELLNHPLKAISVPTIRFFGNVVTGTTEQTQEAINSGILPTLYKLFQKRDQNQRKEICWTLSNICSGTVEQIQEVIDNNFIPLMFEVIEKDSYPVQKEVYYLFSNIIVMGNPQQMNYLIMNRAIEILFNALTSDDAKIIIASLESLLKILKVGDIIVETFNKPVNPYFTHFNELGGIDIIGILRRNHNESVEKISKYIMDKFFPDFESNLSDNEEDF
ncbi:importin alpha [Anaeramoeba flamelloides]|uniref:Importin subunit alpha n=1 Tax=Anaeramoeba flamelloides TaxID=1746091 RepID=A0AAV8A2C2_9EUKA|nr:importin alpha [Anaeramoeba flamelloides]